MTTVPARRAARALPDLAYTLLRLSGWLSITALAALGCFVLLFVMLGGFTADGFFSHLHNLARRFVEADAGRRASFLSLVTTATFVILAIVSACRWRSLLQSLSVSRGADHV